jgi:hypothetical protein
MMTFIGTAIKTSNLGVKLSLKSMTLLLAYVAIMHYVGALKLRQAAPERLPFYNF